MDTFELLGSLAAHAIRETSYSLDGRNQSGRYCLERSRGGWAVFFGERGARNDERWFALESEACEHILQLILDDPTTRERTEGVAAVMASPKTERASVRQFLDAFWRHRSELARGLGWEDGPDLLRRLVERVQAGWVPRRGVAGRISYTIHAGIGCRMCLDGEEGPTVDGDLAADGAFTFDLWRIRQFADSTGLGCPSEHELDEECRQLIREKLLVRLSPRLFALHG